MGPRDAREALGQPAASATRLCQARVGPVPAGPCRPAPAWRRGFPLRVRSTASMLALTGSRWRSH